MKVKCPAAATATAVASAALRLSHRWSNKDVCHKVAQIVADEVAAANADLEIGRYSPKALLKSRKKNKPLSHGYLDMTILPASGPRSGNDLTSIPSL